jgi:hypothetical protein
LTAATNVVWSFEFTAFWTMLRVEYIGAPPTIGFAEAGAAIASDSAAVANNGMREMNMELSSWLTAQIGCGGDTGRTAQRMRFCSPRIRNGPAAVFCCNGE